MARLIARQRAATFEHVDRLETLEARAHGDVLPLVGRLTLFKRFNFTRTCELCSPSGIALELIDAREEEESWRGMEIEEEEDDDDVETRE